MAVKRTPKSKQELDPHDWILLTPHTKASEVKSTSKARPSVPWLRRTEYISSEGKQFGRPDNAGSKCVF